MWNIKIDIVIYIIYIKYIVINFRRNYENNKNKEKNNIDDNIINYIYSCYNKTFNIICYAKLL